MKKILFLISVCLLSQNFTIASECGGDRLSKSVPLPTIAGAEDVLQPSSSLSGTKRIQPQEKLMANIPLPKTNNKIEQQAIPTNFENEPAPTTPKLMMQEPDKKEIPTSVNQIIRSSVNSYISKEIKTAPQVVKNGPVPTAPKQEFEQQFKEQIPTYNTQVTEQTESYTAAETKPESQIVENEPVPITPKFMLKQNDKTQAPTVNKQIPDAQVNTCLQKEIKQEDKVVENEPIPATSKLMLPQSDTIPKKEQKDTKKVKNDSPKKIYVVGPPTPKSNEEVKQEYIKTVQDEQKYKIYSDKKLQNALNPTQEKQEEKKLNLWAEYKKKQSSRPPIIVEDNLSQPTDSNEVRATIKKVEFSESRVFTDEELQKLAAPLLSQPVTIQDIRKVVDGITRCYILGDYATSKAYLPPQDLTDGVLKIGLMEGTVGKVTVQGNRWTRTSYITKRVAPTPGDLLKVSDIEEDIIKFNNNNTVKLNVALSAGEEQGQSDITLNALDPFPFRFAFMTDNQGRQAIGTTRWGGMLAADSLFGFRDRLSLGGYLGRGNRVGFADYNIPVNRFGTRLGASISAGNISVVNGPMRAFGVGGTSQVYTVYATHPLFDREDANISSYTSVNWKRSTSDIADFKIYDKNSFSLSQGFTARKDTQRGIWYTGHYGSVGMKAMNGDYDFFKYEGNITRLHDFGKGIIGQFRISGQYSPNDDLPWMEQFQIGGLSTVRGYSEGLLLGKSGYFASAEIITPLPILPKRIGSDKLGYIYPREMIKGAVFMDNGMIFPYKYGNESIDSGDFLMSWGLGLRVNLREDLAARFYWGFGLNNKYDVDQKLGRFHFDITCAPDIGRVVAERHPKQNKNKKENL